MDFTMIKSDKLSLAKITTYYPAYLERFYTRNKNMVSLSYKDQLNLILDDCFAWSNHLTKALDKLGWRSVEIIANAEPLQRTWCKEKGITYNFLDTLIDQLRSFKPNVVYLEDSFSFPAEWISSLKRKVPSIRTIIGYCSVQYNESHLQRFRQCDFMISCNLGSQIQLKKDGLNAHLSYHAFEPNILRRLHNTNTTNTELIFIGSLLSIPGFHQKRIDLLERLIDANVNIRLHTDKKSESYLKYLLKKATFYTAHRLNKYFDSKYIQKIPKFGSALEWGEVVRDNPVSSKLNKCFRPGMYGIEMFEALSKAKIGFNSHIDSPEGRYAGNMRQFEVTGVGSCLLTDWKENITDIFIPDKEIVTYNSFDECFDKATWLLKNETIRKKIALAGQNRCLKEHTYLQRANQLVTLISNYQ